MTLAAFWWVNQVQAAKYLGSSAYSTTDWDEPVEVDCWVEESVEVSTDTQGTELTSSRTVVRGPLEQADLFVPESKVTLPSGRVARVQFLARYDSGSLALGVEHFEAILN